jgi:hypothetical protein
VHAGRTFRLERSIVNAGHDHQRQSRERNQQAGAADDGYVGTSRLGCRPGRCAVGRPLGSVQEDGAGDRGGHGLGDIDARADHERLSFAGRGG